MARHLPTEPAILLKNQGFTRYFSKKSAQFAPRTKGQDMLTIVGTRATRQNMDGIHLRSGSSCIHTCRNLSTQPRKGKMN